MSEWDFAFGLTGWELEFALTHGATYEEYMVVLQEFDREIIGEHGNNVLVFIDAENIPSKFFKEIEARVSYLVDKWNARIYALQKDRATLGWHEIAKENDAIKEVRLAGGPAKNKVDNKIIKDIRRLVTKSVPAETCVFLVSSDSDYHDIVCELKESGVRTIGIGERKSTDRYRVTFDAFFELKGGLFDEVDDSEEEYYSNEPLPEWYVGGSDAYRYKSE